MSSVTRNVITVAFGSTARGRGVIVIIVIHKLPNKASSYCSGPLPALRSVDRRPAQSDQLVFDRLEPFRQSPPLFRSACAHSTAIRTEPIPTPTVDFSATQAA